MPRMFLPLLVAAVAAVSPADAVRPPPGFSWPPGPLAAYAAVNPADAVHPPPGFPWPPGPLAAYAAVNPADAVHPPSGFSWPSGPLAAVAAVNPAEAVRPPPIPAAGFSWPLAPPHPVVRGFSPPAAPWGPGHRGVDLGGVAGDSVFAVADGVVVFAGHLVDRPLVSIDHAGGLRSTYEPVAPSVTAGESVRRGQVIGSLMAGHPGCVSCLHWGIRRGAEYLNPLVLVSRWRIRLLPVGGGD